MAGEGLRDFFLRLTWRAFEDLGLRESEVARYLAGVLAEFSRADRLYRIRDLRGRPLDSLVEMLLWVQLSPLGEEREGELRRYMGDYALFMSGIFREWVQRHAVLDLYLQEGRRSYERAREAYRRLLKPGSLLLGELARGFEQYADALDYLKRAYFGQPESDPFEEFLRKLEAWSTQRLSSP